MHQQSYCTTHLLAAGAVSSCIPSAIPRSNTIRNSEGRYMYVKLLDHAKRKEKEYKVELPLQFRQ
jgi:hypothetical protein